MNSGTAFLQSLCIAHVAGAAMQSLQLAEAIAGRGLAGDRYAQGAGKFSGRFEVAAGARQLSLIDAAAVAECNLRLGSQLDACELRRNLVISGMDLDGLHGTVLAIGDVRLRVIGDCPPCGYLSRLLGLDARRGLQHIGGMRAAIIEGGLLTVGAPVKVLEIPARQT